MAILDGTFFKRNVVLSIICAVTSIHHFDTISYTWYVHLKRSGELVTDEQVVLRFNYHIRPRHQMARKVIAVAEGHV